MCLGEEELPCAALADPFPAGAVRMARGVSSCGRMPRRVAELHSSFPLVFLLVLPRFAVTVASPALPPFAPRTEAFIFDGWTPVVPGTSLTFSHVLILTITGTTFLSVFVTCEN